MNDQKIVFFQLITQTDPPTAKPWRIVQTIITIDGARSRLTNLCFATEEEARTKYNSLCYEIGQAP